MTASIIDGKKVSLHRQERLILDVRDFINRFHRPPCLAVILVGSDPASHIYVTNKRSACSKVGMLSQSYSLPMQTTQHELLTLINSLNDNSEIDGILVQLPLPKHIDESAVIEHISPYKDVDGFHPYNLGRLAQKNPFLRPCTPQGIIHLLEYYQLSIKGKHAVVIGASNIVGRPMALEFLFAGATVTICHRFTQDLAQHVEQADILVVAAGTINVVDWTWLKPKQIVLDVGIHRLSDGTIRGDIDFTKAITQVAWLTPVPGGIGPMTICSLLENTLKAANAHN